MGMFNDESIPLGVYSVGDMTSADNNNEDSQDKAMDSLSHQRRPSATFCLIFLFLLSSSSWEQQQQKDTAITETKIRKNDNSHDSIAAATTHKTNDPSLPTSSTKNMYTSTSETTLEQSEDNEEEEKVDEEDGDNEEEDADEEDGKRDFGDNSPLKQRQKNAKKYDGSHNENIAIKADVLKIENEYEDESNHEEFEYFEGELKEENDIEDEYEEENQNTMASSQSLDQVPSTKKSKIGNKKYIPIPTSNTNTEDDSVDEEKNTINDRDEQQEQTKVSHNTELSNNGVTNNHELDDWDETTHSAYSSNMKTVDRSGDGANKLRGSHTSTSESIESSSTDSDDVNAILTNASETLQVFEQEEVEQESASLVQFETNTIVSFLRKSLSKLLSSNPVQDSSSESSMSITVDEALEIETEVETLIQSEVQAELRDQAEHITNNQIQNVVDVVHHDEFVGVTDTALLSNDVEEAEILAKKRIRNELRNSTQAIEDTMKRRSIDIEKKVLEKKLSKKYRKPIQLDIDEADGEVTVTKPSKSLEAEEDPRL